MNFIFYFCLLQNVLNTKIKRPQVSIFNETLTPSTYISESQEVIEIQYENILDIFSINLHKRISGEINDDNMNLVEFEKIDHYNNEDCQIIQRNIDVRMQLKLWLDKTGIKEGKYIMDIAISEKYSLAFIVRNDYKLFSVNFNQSAYGIYLRTFDYSFENTLNIKEQNKDETPYLIIDDQSNKVFIFTQHQGVSFNIEVDAHKEIQFNFEDQIQKRDKIYSVHYNNKYHLVFVATGYQGVDIYKIINGSITLQQNLSSQFRNYSQIVDIKSDGEDGLFILDREQGLNFYQIRNEFEYEYQFLINVPDSKSFDFNNNTFFIIAKTSKKQDYVLEIFVNKQDTQYYINNHYFEDMIINDVSVLEQYAILIGNNKHKIVYHSIYSGFIEQKIVSHKSFYEPQLIKTKKFKQNRIDNPNLQSVAVIGRQEFQIINFIVNNPIIKCNMNKQIKNQFLAEINSTRCINDHIETNTQKQLTLCKIYHSFTIQKQNLVQNQVKNVLNIILFWSFVIVFYLRYFAKSRKFTGLKIDQSIQLNNGYDSEIIEQIQLIT
ncbi:unnamed protein product [Paramecium primaurelia]|uniref:Transmembrane protein n=1 Tax=Paramecium primaurelia TaxID=5886 RepID=A0A8S1MF10_PARPR|nr:unnamed protein product [Paramecium primaurelia]